MRVNIWGFYNNPEQFTVEAGGFDVYGNDGSVAVTASSPALTASPRRDLGNPA